MTFNFQISSINSSPSTAASVFVPNIGWVIFGGKGSTLAKAQVLQNLNGSWGEGPDLYNSEVDSNNCGVQVNVNFFSLLCC
jgi:hypothetical protein